MNTIRNYFNFSLKELFLPKVISLEKDSKLDNILFFTSLVATLVSVYILSVQGNNLILLLKKFILVLIPTIIGLRVFLTRRMNFWFLPLLLIVAIYFVLVKRIEVIGEFILLSWMIFLFKLRPSYKLSQKNAGFVGILICLIIGIHFFFFELHHRKSIGGLDPNYSSFLIFLILPIAFYSRSIITHLSIVALGLLTQSRAFFVAIIIYFIVLGLMKLTNRLNLNFKKYFAVASFLFIILLAYSFYSFNLGESSFGQPVYWGYERLLYILNNPSDFQRWKANIVFFQLAANNTPFVMYGMDPLAYIKDINLYLPHNVPLLEMATHGFIIGPLFILFFLSFIKLIYNSKYLPFFASVLVYWLLLGVEIGAIYNVFLVNLMLLLNASEESNPTRKNPHQTEL